MITVEEALKIVLENCPLAEIELVSLDNSLNCVLAEDVFADRHFPPFDRVTMDGIALNFQAFENHQRTFEIEGIAAAGGVLQKLQSNNACIEVMTGAMLPENTDTVIRYEDLEINDGFARVTIDLLKHHQNIHFKGSDRPKNSLLLKKGKSIFAPEIAVLATCGKAKVLVYKTPSVAIISSGDELVNVDVTPLPHQIRKSNSYSIGGALAPFNISANTFHLIDNLEIIRQEVGKIISNHDVVILSGGVSMGKFDYIPQALETLHVQKLFHKVKQRPGKPFWFGISQSGKAVFALPGNPVSSFMCTIKYVLPWMRRHLSLETTPRYAKLTTDVKFKPDLSYFAQVTLRFDADGSINAVPIEGNGSGDLANLADADAFLELPRGRDTFSAGEAFEIHTIKQT